ncbi:phagocyte signaling-impaired protein [Chironomus tepperi]|uniref:phagocyte signaling-impaired protein n=1 Tax=Chironomus tepperi TaxID=113505 RepID=UPI00391FB0FA
MENAVNERRLRIVFDAVDLGNNKKALQEVEKVLKKTPNLKTGLALKALALIRLGREKESQQIINELEKDPEDDSTLQVMTYCYRELDQLDKVCQIYTEAAKKMPGNEELLTQLFMAHVRVNDYKSQQTVALQLFKAKPKNPYYFWAVMSVVLQALRGSESKDKQKAKVLLSLAQKMIDKIIKEDKIEAEQEVQLYLSILEYQEKYEEALEFLQSKVCIDKFPGAPITIKIEIYKKLKKWKDLMSLSQELLQEDPDRWDYYQDYLLACFELVKEGDNSVIDLSFNFINNILKSNSKVRGPYLARIEMHKRMKNNNLDPDALFGDYQDLLIEYFSIFGNKKCCVNDLKMFLEHLPVDRRSELASKLLQDTGISSTTLPQNKDQLQKHICSLQISRLCGSHSSLSIEHLQALYSALTLHYEHSFSAFGKDLLSTDIGPSDQYSILAAHIMYDIAIKSNSSYRLIETLHFLNYLLKNSPSNFHGKLLCLQIFHILGCAMGAHKVYDSLDIKHIQLDSMGYLHCAHLPSTALATLSKPIYDQTLKFFTASYKDSLEYLALSYKYGSFSKLQEFMDFREKLSNSLHYSMVSVEALLQEIVAFNGTNQQNYMQFQNMKIEPNEDRIKYEELTDNRDLNVMLRWDPIRNENNESLYDKIKDIEKESFNQEVVLLRIRSTLLRIVASSVELINTPYRSLNTKEQNGHSSNSSVEDGDESHKILIDTWDEHFKLLEMLNYQPTSSQFLVNLLPSRLHVILQLPYNKVISLLGKFVYNLWMSSEKTKELGNDLQQAFLDLKSFIENLEPVSEASNLFYYRDLQAKFIGCVEIMSLCSFVLSLCYEKCNHNQAQTTSKKKKQQTNSEVKENSKQITMKEKVSLITEIIRNLKSALNTAEKSLEKLKPLKVEKNLNEYLASLSINPKESNKTNNSETTSVITTVNIDIHTIFDENYQQSVKEISMLIKDKLKLINVK